MIHIFVFTETLRMAGKMSDVEYTVMDQWYRLLNNEIPESPTGFDLSSDLIGEYEVSEHKNSFCNKKISVLRSNHI